MNRKLISLAGALVAGLSLASAGQVAQAQSYGGNCPPGTDCYGRPVNCFGSLKACMYGQMVTDALGQTIRVYGYPAMACGPCGPNGYNVYPGYSGHHSGGLMGSRSRHGGGYSGSSSLLSSGYTGAGACCTATPLSCCSAQAGGNMIQPAYETPKALPGVPAPTLNPVPTLAPPIEQQTPAPPKPGI